MTRQLTTYKGLDRRWQDWTDVADACAQLADRLVAHTDRGDR